MRKASLTGVLLIAVLAACAGLETNEESSGWTPARYREMAAWFRAQADEHSAQMIRFKQDEETRGHCEDIVELSEKLARKYEAVARGIERVER